MARPTSLFITLLLCAACSSSGMVETALHGDLKTLKQSVQEQQRQGDLDSSDVEALARAVAAREVQSAQGPEGAARVRHARLCAGALEPVLQDRAERADEPAAEAALALLETGALDRQHAIERHADSSSGAWRAVAARAAVLPEQGPLRRRFIADPDERVRRAALAAAQQVRAPADLDAVLEAARLDPDPVSRSLAIRTAGAIGGTRSVHALADLWGRASSHLRVAIVDAWSMPAAFRAGGSDRLVRVVATESGLPAVAAASALVRLPHPETPVAVATLARAIEEGTTAERIAAISSAPLEDPAVRRAVLRAAGDDDRSVRVQALGRLTSLQQERAAAIAALRKLSAGNSPEAVLARLELARAGDTQVAALLAKDLQAPSAWQRLQGALGLVELERLPTAATALADDDPDVRLGVSCSIIARR